MTAISSRTQYVNQDEYEIKYHPIMTHGNFIKNIHNRYGHGFSLGHMLSVREIYLNLKVYCSLLKSWAERGTTLVCCLNSYQDKIGVYK